MRSIKLAGITLLFLTLLSTMGSASAAIKISKIQFDPAGSDTQAKLNQEFVVVKNTGVRRVSITGKPTLFRSPTPFRTNRDPHPPGVVPSL